MPSDATAHRGAASQYKSTDLLSMAVIHSVAAMWSHARWMADRVVLPVALGARRETTDTEPHSGRGHRTTGCRSRYERRPAYSDRAVPTLLPSHRELLLLMLVHNNSHLPLLINTPFDTVSVQ
ncbi:hypothetical protein J6590_057670 [Homalodisca vitripennis]|nr:hypothetical protein J6590_057670 [Homalodisca vitripennis]